MISFILWHVFANKDLDKVPTNLLNCQTLLPIYNYFLSGRSMLEAKGPTQIITSQIIFLVTRKQIYNTLKEGHTNDRYLFIIYFCKL